MMIGPRLVKISQAEHFDLVSILRQEFRITPDARILQVVGMHEHGDLHRPRFMAGAWRR